MIRYLRKQDVGAVFHYVPLHSSQGGKRYGRFAGEDRYTTKESSRLIRLPMWYGMSAEELKWITDCFTEGYQQCCIG